jgi:hypothetical protein
MLKLLERRYDSQNSGLAAQNICYLAGGKGEEGVE